MEPFKYPPTLRLFFYARYKKRQPTRSKAFFSLVSLFFLFRRMRTDTHKLPHTTHLMKEGTHHSVLVITNTLSLFLPVLSYLHFPHTFFTLAHTFLLYFRFTSRFSPPPRDLFNWFYYFLFYLILLFGLLLSQKKKVN